MRTAVIVSLALGIAATSALSGQSAPQSFRSSVNLILVDVTVRDGKGLPIRNLQASDFEVLENGKPQAVLTFAQEEITQTASTIVTAATLSRVGGTPGAVPVTVSPTAASPANAAPRSTESAGATVVDASQGPLTSSEVAGHRVWVLLFDTSSMQPEDVQKAADAAITWGQERMSTADLVAVA